MGNEYSDHKILIVDDTPGDIKIIGEALKQDRKVIFATTGEDALSLAMESPPQLILLDIMLPGIDGYEVCRRLKSDKKTQDIPIIFITAKNRQEDEAMGLGLGAVDYITKPFFLPIVKARVQTHLELKQHRDMLERLTSLDGLTGIPNRRRFDEYLDHEWKKAVHESASLSVIMMDIDYFKPFNDNYGHCAGDECLREIAEALEKSLERPADFVARYGGEEFSVIMPEADIKTAVSTAETIRANVEALDIKHLYSRIAKHVTMSMGAASAFPTHDGSPTSLLEAADQLLYKAKTEGRNQVKGMNFECLTNRSEMEDRIQN
ncbi:MAG: diguanylate cyclase [Desulfobacterales bacterium]|nr:diguanylate cyclase [Desulfobacterales bacterium]